MRKTFNGIIIYIRDNMKAWPQSIYHKKTLCLLVFLIALLPSCKLLCVYLCLSVCVITLIPLHTTAIAAGFAKLTFKRL